MDRDRNQSAQTPSITDAKRKQSDRGVDLIATAVKSECQRNAAATNNMMFVKTSLTSCIFEAIAVDSIKGHVNMLSESAWNSPEYWLPRSVPIIRLGIIGHPTSKRNELLRSFLGSGYVTLHDQLGCRTKLPMRIGDRDYLIIIREESGSPAQDFMLWVDTVIITANSGRTTSVAESYVKFFKEIRSIREVHVVLASIREDKSQSMEFIPRFRCLCVDAPYIEVDLETKVNVHCPFRIACEGFVSRSWRPQTPFTFRTPNPLSRRPNPTYFSQTPGFDSSEQLPTSTKTPHSQLKPSWGFATPNEGKFAPTPHFTRKTSNVSSRATDRGKRSVRFAGSIPSTTTHGNEADKVLKPHPSWTQSKIPEASPYLQELLKPKTRGDGAVASVTKERTRPYPRKIVTSEVIGSNRPPKIAKSMDKKQLSAKPVAKRGCASTPRLPKTLDSTVLIESDED